MLLKAFIKSLFIYSLFSAIRMVSSTYLRLLIFLPAILIPVCASSSLAFHMMYSAGCKISRVTIYSLDVPLSQFWASPLFHIWFWPLLLDLHHSKLFLNYQKTNFANKHNKKLKTIWVLNGNSFNTQVDQFIACPNVLLTESLMYVKC